MLTLDQHPHAVHADTICAIMYMQLHVPTCCSTGSWCRIETPAVGRWQTITLCRCAEHVCYMHMHKLLWSFRDEMVRFMTKYLHNYAHIHRAWLMTMCVALHAIVRLESKDVCRNFFKGGGGTAPIGRTHSHFSLARGRLNFNFWLLQ